MRIRFHTQYKFLHIQMVVSSVLPLYICILHVPTYIYCIIVQCGDHCGWIANCARGQWFDLKYNTCIQLYTTVGSIVAIILILINDPATHCLSKQSMYSWQTIVLCTESGLPVERKPLWTVHLLKVASFSTCQRKKTVHRIAQQVLSHWVKWSPLPQQVTQTNLPACYRVTLPGQII